MLGSKLSADSEAKTRLGLSVRLAPAAKLIQLGLASNAINPRGVGTESPTKRSPFLKFISSVPLHTALPLFRRIHVSAFNFCKSLFR